jgi:two-component system heavy metal sensor histidine kinase CusS
VIADPDRIAQALRNLIENAVRHSAPGSSVQIVTSREGDVAVARVVNAGSPLDPAAVPGLFERFVRGDEDGAGAPPGGPASSHAGLGLAIAKAIVEASGGSITAESDAVTTRFTIRLAISRSMASQALLRP